LEGAGFSLTAVRELPGFVEAVARKGEATTLIQWAVDSAFRFFPLVQDKTLGLSLHPFDLAANKVLALVGRAEARDWVDIIGFHSRLQELGYLIWAACGKDPGLNPELILNEAVRSARYTREEISALDFEGPSPDAGDLSREWKKMISQAAEIIALLPPEKMGTCVLDKSMGLFRGDSDALKKHLESGGIRFHPGRIHGAFPSFP
jgi:hypothetical protein